MNENQESLSSSQLEDLVKLKRREIKSLEESLSTRRLELFSFQLLQRKLQLTKTDTIFSEFIAAIKKNNPEISILLEKCELISLEPGKLKLKAIDIDGEVLFFHKSLIEDLLKEHFAVSFNVIIIHE